MDETRFSKDKVLPTLEYVRRELMKEALIRCGDDPKKAADMLGVSWRTVYREMNSQGRDNRTEQLRREYQQALDDAKGNSAQASRALGKSRSAAACMIHKGRIKRNPV